jgi:TctA family transporter
METSLRQSLTIAQGDLLIFFKRPFSAVLMILVIVAVAVSQILSAKGKRKILKVRMRSQHDHERIICLQARDWH